MIADAGYTQAAFLWFGIIQGGIVFLLAWLLRAPSPGDIPQTAAPKVQQSSFTPLAGRKIQGVTSPRGFGCRVTENGARSFALRYWNPAQHLVVIGEFPTWKPLAAVNRARQLRQKIDAGWDPLVERKAKREEEERAAKAAVEAVKAAEDAAERAICTTTKATLESYLQKACGVTRDANGEAVYAGTELSTLARRRIRALFYPKLGDIQIAALKRSQINEVLDEIPSENVP